MNDRGVQPKTTVKMICNRMAEYHDTLMKYDGACVYDEYVPEDSKVSFVHDESNAVYGPRMLYTYITDPDRIARELNDNRVGTMLSLRGFWLAQRAFFIRIERPAWQNSEFFTARNDPDYKRMREAWLHGYSGTRVVRSIHELDQRLDQMRVFGTRRAAYHDAFYQMKLGPGLGTTVKRAHCE